MRQRESEHEKFHTTRQAVVAAPDHTGPTTERYESALSRYLAAVSGAPRPRTRTDSTLGDEYSWHLGNHLVRDVMTRVVVTVPADAPFKDIVDLLARHRVGAVPVIAGDGTLLGIVSASDLVAKIVTGGDPHAYLRGVRAERVRTRRKASAEVARDLMTAPAITVQPDDTVVHAARKAAGARVRRLPVVDANNVLIGIVTRSDLLQLFMRDDHEIRSHVESLVTRRFCIDPSSISILVDGGVVILAGQVERRTLIKPLVDAVRASAGVVGVHDQLTYRFDDRIVPPPRPPLY